MTKVFSKRRAIIGLLLALILALPAWAAAQTTFDRIVVFGDSLSDPGNAFIFQGTANVPPYDGLDPLLVPTMSYARGGHHFSNGHTWVEQLARRFALSKNTRPAFAELGLDATNYAIGGARAHDSDSELSAPTFEEVATLSYEVTAFLQVFGWNAPQNALYVVEFGSNDVRDAMEALDPSIVEKAVASVQRNMVSLIEAGAVKFMVCNAPDLSLTPAVITLDKVRSGTAAGARALSSYYNLLLSQLVATLKSQYPEIQVVQVDFFDMLVEIVSDPSGFGLSFIDTPCITPGTPPFTCSNPDDYLFWDGIHPTQTVHAIMAQQALSELAK
jgi:phospholipase/lecithinase/hemolysin